MKIVLRPAVVKITSTGKLEYISAEMLKKLYRLPKRIPVEVFNPRQKYGEDTLFLRPLVDEQYEAERFKLGLKNL